MAFHFLNILYRQSPSSNFSKTNYEFASIAKDSAKNKKLSYIVALERGLNVSVEANIQPTVIESQI